MTLAPGTHLGPYEILAPIGAGGMGEIYRARDRKLDRDVAIKVLPESVATDPETLARFEREAKAVAALSHPNILAIHDFGEHAGVAYAVMELLEGETLREKLVAGPIRERQTVDYALQIARGLSAAHEKGVVHRDLKPENVFVTRDGHVKILDFGLAKKVESTPPGEETSAPTGTSRTEPGTVMGTLGYMSPEQVRGLPVDHRSDIFSFGAMLYELLSGRRAFQKETASDTMAAILRDDPQELTESGRNISPSLDNVVRHCLEKDRSNRFPSAREIVFALSQASSPTVTSAAAIARPRLGRHLLLIAGAILGVIAVAAVVFFLPRKPVSARGAEAVRRVAVLPFENLGSPDDDYFADGIADEIRGKLTTLRGVEVIARASSTPYKRTTKTPEQIAEELDVSYLLTATVRWVKAGETGRVLVRPELVHVSGSGAPTSKWQQPFDAALTDVFAVQSDIATRVAQALGVALAVGEQTRLAGKPTQNLAAYDAFLRGEEAGGNLGVRDPAGLRRAMAFYEQSVALDPRFAQAWAHLSRASAALYGYGTPSPALAERARTAAERAVALAPNRPEGHLALGDYERLIADNPDRALARYREAQRRAPGNADAFSAVTIAEIRLGEWEMGLEHLGQGERLDPRSLISKRRLALGYLFMRRYAEARESLVRGLALAPSNLSLIEYDAMTHVAKGDLAGARAVLRAVPANVDRTELVAQMARASWNLVWVLPEEQLELLLRLTPSAFDDDEGVWGLSLAQGHALRADDAAVRFHAEEARKAFEQQLLATPDHAQLRGALGLALSYLGRKEDAIRQGERAVALVPLPRDAFVGPTYQHQLARIYILVGEPGKALDRLEPLLKIPYVLSPGWLRIDPTFEALRDNPRFQKLVAGAE